MNLYISRLMLNPRSRCVANELANPYEMHRTLMRAFPEAGKEWGCQARSGFGMLFRAETSERNNEIKVYVQSLVEPSWDFLHDIDDYLCKTTYLPECECKNIWPVYQKISCGQKFSFRLRANPTKRIGRRDDESKGKRVELYSEDEQIKWLIRKGETSTDTISGGFIIPVKNVIDDNGKEHALHCLRVRSEGKFTSKKRSVESFLNERGAFRMEAHKMTHFAVMYEGLLQVTNVDAFLQTILKGVGSGKAFGFGLLSIAPAEMLGLEG